MNPYGYPQAQVGQQSAQYQQPQVLQHQQVYVPQYAYTQPQLSAAAAGAVFPSPVAAMQFGQYGTVQAAGQPAAVSSGIAAVYPDQNTVQMTQAMFGTPQQLQPTASGVLPANAFVPYGQGVEKPPEKVQAGAQLPAATGVQSQQPGSLAEGSKGMKKFYEEQYEKWRREYAEWREKHRDHPDQQKFQEWQQQMDQWQKLQLEQLGLKNTTGSQQQHPQGAGLHHGHGHGTTQQQTGFPAPQVTTQQDTLGAQQHPQQPGYQHEHSHGVTQQQKRLPAPQVAAQPTQHQSWATQLKPLTASSQHQHGPQAAKQAYGHLPQLQQPSHGQGQQEGLQTHRPLLPLASRPPRPPYHHQRPPAASQQHNPRPFHPRQPGQGGEGQPRWTSPQKQTLRPAGASGLQGRQPRPPQPQQGYGSKPPGSLPKWMQGQATQKPPEATGWQPGDSGKPTPLPKWMQGQTTQKPPEAGGGHQGDDGRLKSLPKWMQGQTTQKPPEVAGGQQGDHGKPTLLPKWMQNASKKAEAPSDQPGEQTKQLPKWMQGKAGGDKIPAQPNEANQGQYEEQKGEQAKALPRWLQGAKKASTNDAGGGELHKQVPASPGMGQAEKADDAHYQAHLQRLQKQPPTTSAANALPFSTSPQKMNPQQELDFLRRQSEQLQKLQELEKQMKEGGANQGPHAPRDQGMVGKQGILPTPASRVTPGSAAASQPTATPAGKPPPYKLYPCKFFPRCRNGSKCTFIHPPCKFGDRCQKADCLFDHSSSGSSSDKAAAVNAGLAQGNMEVSSLDKDILDSADAEPAPPRQQEPIKGGGDVFEYRHGTERPGKLASDCGDLRDAECRDAPYSDNWGASGRHSPRDGWDRPPLPLDDREDGALSQWDRREGQPPLPGEQWQRSRSPLSWGGPPPPPHEIRDYPPDGWKGGRSWSPPPRGREWPPYGRDGPERDWDHYRRGRSRSPPPLPPPHVDDLHLSPRDYGPPFPGDERDLPPPRERSSFGRDRRQWSPSWHRERRAHSPLPPEDHLRRPSSPPEFARHRLPWPEHEGPQYEWERDGRDRDDFRGAPGYPKDDVYAPRRPPPRDWGWYLGERSPGRDPPPYERTPRDREYGRAPESRYPPTAGRPPDDVYREDYHKSPGEYRSRSREDRERDRQEAPPVEKKPAIPVESILDDAGRDSRPDRIVIILRGPPGSGKTHVARLIKDKEVSCGAHAPRILALDDYFLVESEKTETDPETGKRVKKKVTEYVYEAEMEEAYRASLFKVFSKTLEDGFFPVVIVDAIHSRVKHFSKYWSHAKEKGFQVYVAELMADAHACAKRNSHHWSFDDISKMVSEWEETPAHYLRLDVRSLLQDAVITEVEMEAADDAEPARPPPEEEEEARDESAEATTEPEAHFPSKSKWEELDSAQDKLNKLDGIRPIKRKRAESPPLALLEDDDPYDEREEDMRIGKKRVRWADIEEKKSLEHRRRIGFCIGTDWSLLTDPDAEIPTE